MIPRDYSDAGPNSVPFPDIISRHNTPPTDETEENKVTDNDVAIAIMGATGTGKTTFINLVSGSDLTVGKGLESCTSSIQVAPPFELFGRSITLIDTPGFDDSSRSETDVLKTIALFLETSYQSGQKLHGVIYLHRISDFRVGGVSKRNFSLFRQLCGDTTLKNVVIATNMWGEVTRLVGAAREQELASKDMFFKPALDKQAKLLRHENTLDSARFILRCVIDNHPMPLRIQRELVEEHKVISETAAANEINRELMEQARHHDEELRGLQKKMETALQNKDEDTRKLVETKTREVELEMQRAKEESLALESDYKEEKARLDRTMREMAEASRQKAEKAAIENQFQLQVLRDRLHAAAQASANEQEAIRRQVADLECQVQQNSNSPKRKGIFGKIGRAMDTVLRI